MRTRERNEENENKIQVDLYGTQANRSEMRRRASYYVYFDSNYVSPTNQELCFNIYQYILSLEPASADGRPYFRELSSKYTFQKGGCIGTTQSVVSTVFRHTYKIQKSTLLPGTPSAGLNSFSPTSHLRENEVQQKNNQTRWSLIIDRSSTVIFPNSSCHHSRK